MHCANLACELLLYYAAGFILGTSTAYFALKSHYNNRNTLSLRMD